MRSSTLLLLIVFLTIPNYPAYAAEDATLKAERRAAQKERQEQKTVRNQNIQAAAKTFRQFSGDLKQEYKEKMRQLDIDFKLESIDLKAERDSKIAMAEQGMQQTFTQLMMNFQQVESEEAVAQLKTRIKQHSDEVFAIKKAAAKVLHDAMLSNERKKHELLTERDQKALAEAQELGLRDRPEPILAEAIGGELTKQEEKWNEREAKETERLLKNNERLFNEFVYGQNLRQWEIGNKQEDFDLEWQKREELHNINSEQMYYSLFSFAGGGNQQEQQQRLNEKISEITTQTRLINIKYQKLKEKNKVKRNEDKRRITGR